MNGLFNEMSVSTSVPETVAQTLQHIDDSGGPNSYPSRRSRLGRDRRRAVHLDAYGCRQRGGCRNPLVVHWPKGIAAKGEVRSQWHHVIDIPTILEAAGLSSLPEEWHGIDVTIEGPRAWFYSSADAKAKDRHRTQ